MSEVPVPFLSGSPPLIPCVHLLMIEALQNVSVVNDFQEPRMRETYSNYYARLQEGKRKQNRKNSKTHLLFKENTSLIHFKKTRYKIITRK